MEKRHNLPQIIEKNVQKLCQEYSGIFPTRAEVEGFVAVVLARTSGREYRAGIAERTLRDAQNLKLKCVMLLVTLLDRRVYFAI